MNYLKIYLCIAALVATGVASNNAEATHKAWVMKNAGGSCVRQYPGSDDAYPGVVKNFDPWGVYVTCPVTLAGRSGSSSSPNIPPKTWLAAKQARIHYKQTNSAFWCQARAGTASGSVYYSRGRWSSGGGVQTIDLIDNENDWGGSLEAVDANSFIQLDFDCRVGSRSTDGFTPAELYGVDVATCQNSENCNTVSVDSRQGQSWVQGSGIECAPGSTSSAAYLQRTVNGYYNSHSQNTALSFCPITTAADDSYEHSRLVSNARVYWTGSSAPSCKLVSRDYQGNYTESPFLQLNSFWGYLQTQGSFTAGVERSLALRCEQPPGTTVVGWTVQHSVTRKSGGI